MNPESAALLRAIRGPVMMITIGVLFALDTFTPLHFHRTWPVLLVVAGLLNLGKRNWWDARVKYQAQWGPPRPPFPPPPPPPQPPFQTGWSRPQPMGPGTYRGSQYAKTPASSTPPKKPDTGVRQ